MPEKDLRLKYAAAEQLGLTEKLLRVGWAGLSAQETGRIGSMVKHMRMQRKET